MKEAGFIEIFVNNDAQTPVYYDNMAVTMSSGPVVEVYAYYPFGMFMPGLSNISLSVPNLHRFSAKELQKELELQWYDHGARMLSTILRRWMCPDPLAEKYYWISPYAFCNNNPIRYIDPDGREIWSTSDPEQIKRLLQDLKNIYSSKYGEDEVKEDPFSFRTVETETLKYHVLEANPNFDWNLDEYTKAMKQILDDKYRVRMYIVNDPDKDLIKKEGGGKVMKETGYNAFKLSSRLANFGEPGTKGADPQEWTIGGVFLHETIYHLHYRGQVEQNREGTFPGYNREYTRKGPNYMRAYYGTKANGHDHNPGTYYKFPSGKN